MAHANILLDRQKGQVAALVERGSRFHERGKLTNALRAFDDAIAMDAGNAALFCLRGNVLADMGEAVAAIGSYDRAIALDPRSSQAHDFRGVALAQMGDLAGALRSVEVALSLAPDNLNALNNRANLLRDMDRLTEALEVLTQMIARHPDFAPGRALHARTLADMGRHEEALAALEQAIARGERTIETLCNRATALTRLGRTEEGIAAFREALGIQPDHVQTHFNLGEALASLKQYEEAQLCYRRCIALAPAFVEAGLSLGLLLSLQRRFDEAGRCYQQVLTQDLNNQRALHGLARAMEEFGQFQSALTCYDHLLSTQSGDALAHRKRGQVMLNLSDQEEAIRCIDRARALDPAMALPSTRLHSAMHLSQWDDFDTQLEEVRQGVAVGTNDMMAFPILALVDDPALQRASSCNLAANQPMEASVPLTGRYARHDKIRLGYFSADFNHHATMQLFAETLEAHDRDRFELTAFTFGQGKEDEWQARAKNAFDHFVDVRLKDDALVAQIAREREIDIAIDLKGYTHNCRFGIFAERAAPVQVSYLGYPGTSGAPYIDYIVADEMLIHPDYREHVSEKIIYLPDSYQANAALRPVTALATKADAGLPEWAFIFCCFNQNYKITPEVFDAWMRILQQVDASVLWLWVDRETARQNLVREAEARGISGDRLIFAKAEPTERHIDRLQLGDLFLDTFPCNAHTTASDSLRAGLPLLTFPGKAFAARVAASLLNAVDMPELIATDLADYERRAVALAQDREGMREIREKLARNLVRSTLFDPQSMARRLEAAYGEIYARSQAGKPPADIRFG